MCSGQLSQTKGVLKVARKKDIEPSGKCDRRVKAKVEAHDDDSQGYGDTAIEHARQLQRGTATEHSAQILQGVWSTVSAFVIDTRSIRSIFHSVSAVRAMSAVSKELGIMVQDTCEAAYKQHEVLQMVVPFAVEAWLITSINELGCHHQI